MGQYSLGMRHGIGSRRLILAALVLGMILFPILTGLISINPVIWTKPLAERL